jgi:hypothetical protein
MNAPRFALITPSYEPDFERCALLARSVKEFVDPSITHYIAVEKRDLHLFRQLAGPRTKIIRLDEILPWWVFRVPLVRSGWMSLKTKPVRNWIMQQAVKLSLPRMLSEEVLLFADSDVAFVRPFDGQPVLRDGDVRLVRMPGEGNIDYQHPWHQTAAKLLGLPPCDYFGARHIAQLVSWRRDNALRMHAHIEATSGRPWLETILSQWHLSEYILYGVYADEVLRDDAGHWTDANNLCHEYWPDQPLSEAGLRKFFELLEPHHVAVMISAKARMGVEEYRNWIEAAALAGATA